MFRRVLIANRGEVALRIARACRALGVESVVAYSAADRDAPWVREASEGVCVGPARARDSYLDAGAILHAAEQYECQAIHPGYGFLAENAVFAARCEQQGISFVGPPASAIRSMGDKAEAKRTLARLGIPTIPGSDGVLRDLAEAHELARSIGFPVLLKASAGGGGKGMRRCRDASELEQGFVEARLEAEQSFGNPALYLEKLIERGRHIEFQLLCDNLGHGVHLGERECSIQRRHQKLIEESPSPVVDAATRERFGQSVVDALTRSGYRNAGTVEFLRDDQGQFYFMEMNTRLQVEHPVTEMITGVDIVQQQLRIAANQPLSLQRSPEPVGHAIEFRINAEDPARDFRPDVGCIERFEPPTVRTPGARVRWDSPVENGYRISPHYDSLVGKLIVHAADRTGALAAAREALDSLVLEGIRTTVPLHRELVDDPRFVSGSFDVEYLGRRLANQDTQGQE